MYMYMFTSQHNDRWHTQAHENYKRQYLKFRYEICKYFEDLLRVVVVPVLAEVHCHLLDLLHRLRVNVEETHNLV